MYYRILATLALSFVFYVGSSQISYHRLYETTLDDTLGINDTIFYHMASTTISGDVYAMGTKRVGDSALDYDDLSIIFTKHNDKGNIDWSKELDLGVDTVDLQGIGSIAFNGEKDSILFVFGAEINDQHVEIFGRLDKSGNGLNLTTIDGGQFGSINFTLPDVAPFVNQSDLILTPTIEPTISRLGLGDDLIWSRSYMFLNTDGDTILNRLYDINTTMDTTIAITGTSRDFGREFVVAELDSNGVQIWAESYTFLIDNIIGIQPFEIEPLTNGGFAVIGSYRMSGTVSDAFVAIIDTAGSIVTAKNLLINDQSTGLFNIAEGTDGALWISGIYSNLDSTQYFTTNMNLDGTINWTTIYPEQEAGFSPFATSLLDVQSTGGKILVGHGFKDDLDVMQVMKHNVDGTTPCSDTITTIVEDLMVITDTLFSQVKNGGIFFDTLAFEFDNFNGFSPPTLTINYQYPPFCPNELIDTFLIAIVDQVDTANVSYLWSTGEINDTIRVMAEGQYSVTVTISEDVCFTMCDTIELTRLMLPQIAITQDNNRFCKEKIIVLTGNYTPGAPNETYLWNTLETTPSIEVTEPGVYSVTVTDECGEIASDDIDVSLPEFDPSVFFGSNTNDFCNTGSAIVTAAYSGGGNDPVFTWSDGQSGMVIVVNTEGEYSVTVTDECDFMATATNNVVFPIIATDAEIIITPNCDEDNIMASTVIFEAIGSGEGELELAVYTVNNEGIQTLISSLENPTEALHIFDLMNDELNDFIVFAINTCGEVLDSLSISGSAICSPLQYPIAFFPQGDEEASKTFGPIPLDTLDLDRITEVEFKVFNRWGETVFESNAILEAWDGSHKGEPAPSEVYIYYVSYLIDGMVMLDDGDVTLIR